MALNSIFFVLNAIKHHVCFALLIEEWLLSSELMISVLLQLPVLLPVDLLIFFSSLSSMGRISSEHIFLSLALGQTTCTNCTSMDKDWSKPVVMGIYWTAW